MDEYLLECATLSDVYQTAYMEEILLGGDPQEAHIQATDAVSWVSHHPDWANEAP